jgi:hypothetical protein
VVTPEVAENAAMGKGSKVEINMGNSQSAGMKRRLSAAVTAAGLSVGMILTGGCGQQLTQAKAFVVIDPGALTTGTGTIFTVFASSNNNSVTWSLGNGSGCPTSGCGSLAGATGTGVNYLPPASIPGSSMTISITATSTLDSSVKSSETVTVYPEYVTLTGPAANSTVVPLTTANFSAVVVNDPAAQGVRFSLSGTTCSGIVNSAAGCGVFLSNSSAQATFFAPPAPQLESVTITATSINAPNESASITVMVPKLSIYIYTPAVLPAAFDGQAYSAQTSIVGNTPPYTVSISNPIPSWLSIRVTQGVPSTNGPAGCDPTAGACPGNTLTFSGTPPAGTPETTLYPTINVSDAATPTDTGGQLLTIAVYPQAGTANTMLQGSYAFYGLGFHDGTLAGTYGNSQNPYYYVGSLTADGNGNITGGELDINDSLSPTGITTYASLGGTYEIQASSLPYPAASGTATTPNSAGQTGYITLVPPGSSARPIALAVSLSSLHPSSSNSQISIASQGHIVEWDDTTGIGTSLSGYSSGVRTSGSLALQSAAALNMTASPVAMTPFGSGSGYAYGLNGFSANKDFPIQNFSSKSLYCLSGGNGTPTNPSCGPISVAGSMTFGQGGAIQGGTEDLLVGEQHSNPTLSGTTANSGIPDANGRVVATINTAVTSTMPDWPTHFAMYAINPSGTPSGGEFFMMSIDPVLTSSALVGEADQQNLADIASTPFTATYPIVNYVNENGAGNYNDQGTNGQDRVILQMFLPAPTGPTAGSFTTAVQYTNLSGTYTTTQVPGNVSPTSWTYTVNSNTGRVVPSNNSNISEPCMYLSDTNTGWGVQCYTSQQSGLWQFAPQTATSLNGGIYSYYVYSQIEPVAPLEVGTVWMPQGGVANNGTPFSTTGGYDYTQFYNAAGAGAYTTGESIEYTGAITSGTIAIQATGGEIYHLTAAQNNGFVLFGAGSTGTQSTFQGCGQTTTVAGGGFILSPTSFVCVPSGGSFGGIHVFTQ